MSCEHQVIIFADPNSGAHASGLSDAFLVNLVVPLESDLVSESRNII